MTTSSIITQKRSAFSNWLATLPAGLGKALVFSQVFALIWFGLALYVRSTGRVPIWFDQQATFMQAPFHVPDPYTLPRFMYPPWTAGLLAPLGVFPFAVAILIQTCLYFALLTAVIFKFGGKFQTVVLVLTSYIALNAVLELNLEWLICIGLLVPPAWSSPFLLVKPQVALGVLVTYRWRDLVRTILLALTVVLISFVIWGGWPLASLKAIQTYTLGASFNIAPLALLPWPVALAIGLYLMWRAFRKRDAPLSLIAWIFFVPYIPLYSLLIPFAAVAIRFRLLALIISVVMWIFYGGVLLLALFS
jgi:hypothetical protein